MKYVAQFKDGNNAHFECDQTLGRMFNDACFKDVFIFIGGQVFNKINLNAIIPETDGEE